jgi:hypothetical protein
MANQDFEEVVAAATAQASVSRKQLGCSYAAEFKQNPDVFDPRKLIALGREGLLSIVTTVSVPTCGLEHRISSEREMPYRRALAEICRGACKLSRTILSFSSSDQRRRRPVSTTSSRSTRALRLSMSRRTVLKLRRT